MAATTCGLDSDMVKTMTIGNLVDYVTTYNKLHGLDKADNREGTRMATQEDFDMFWSKEVIYGLWKYKGNHN